jgi:excisionase family DNA binding protein
MQHENERYYTSPELAAVYKVTRQAIWSWIKQGRIKAIRLGTKYRISESEWMKFLDTEQAR